MQMNSDERGRAPRLKESIVQGMSGYSVRCIIASLSCQGAGYCVTTKPVSHFVYQPAYIACLSLYAYRLVVTHNILVKFLWAFMKQEITN